jgi:aryl-alcohol dehydrogenase-like predicted oxidoreductase
MRVRQIGASGVELSEIGLGGYELGHEATHVEGARAAIEAAVETRVNWIDTAEAYHDTANETLIGEALRRVAQRPLVSSKRCPEGDSFTAAGIHAGCRESLGRLGLDHLDLYFLHWPDEPDGAPLDETWGAMGELVDQGLVRAIGLSNFTLGQIDACHAARPVDVVQDGLSLIDHLHNRELFQACGERGIGVVVYEPLASGLLTGAIRDIDDLRRTWGDDLEDWSFYNRLCAPGKWEKTEAVISALAEVSLRCGVSISKLAVAWVLAQRGATSAICGSGNPAHVRDNAAAAELELSADTIAELEALAPLGPTFA